MLDSISKKRYKELQDRVKQYQKYGRPKAWLEQYWVPTLFLVLFLSAMVTSLVSKEVTSTVLGILAIIYLIIVLVADGFLERKSRIYELNTDDWVVYYSLSIIDNLDKSEAKKDRLKKEFRKKAIGASRDLLALIKTKWIVGDFKIAEAIFGDQISNFKSNLEYRVIPSLEKSDYPDLRKVESVFYNLASRLCQKNPSIADLEALNKNMLMLPSWEKEVKMKQRGKMRRLKDSVWIHGTLKHASVLGTIVLIGCTVYVAGLHFDLVSKDNAFIASTSLMGLLVVAYLDYLRKEKKT